MKRSLLLVLTLMALSAAVCAETVLLSETFEGTTGAEITTLGWTQTQAGPPITISDTVIDVGKSGVVASPDDPGNASVYRKDVAATIGDNQEIVLTATVHVYPESFILDEAGFWITTPRGDYVILVSKENQDGQPPVRRWKIRTPSERYPQTIYRDLPKVGGVEVKDYDIKVVLTKVRASFYGRAHGASSWTFLYDSRGVDSVSNVTLYLWNQNYDDPPGEPPYVDSVRLVKNDTISEATPEYMLWEDFNDYSPGDDINKNPPGVWTADYGSALAFRHPRTNDVDGPIDSGLMAATAGLHDAWANYTRQFASTILMDNDHSASARAVLYAQAGEYYTDNQTSLKVSDSSNNQWQIGLSVSPSATAAGTWSLSTPLGSRTFAGPTGGGCYDAKITVSRCGSQFFVRQHGASEWTSLYSDASGTWNLKSVSFSMYSNLWAPTSWYRSCIDTIVVTREVLDTPCPPQPFSSYTEDFGSGDPVNLNTLGWTYLSSYWDGRLMASSDAAVRTGTTGRALSQYSRSVTPMPPNPVTNGSIPSAAYGYLKMKKTIPGLMPPASGLWTYSAVVYAPKPTNPDPTAYGGGSAQSYLGVSNGATPVAYWYSHKGDLWNGTVPDPSWVFYYPGGSWVLPWRQSVPYLFDTSVVATIFMDFDNSKIWGKVSNGNPSQDLLSPKFAFTGTFDSLYVYMRSMDKQTGFDVDNITVAQNPDPDPVSLTNARKLSDTTRVKCSGTVTAVFGDSFYIEDSNRVAGIRVTKSGHGVSVGQGKEVVGAMATLSSTERYIAAEKIGSATASTILPLGMNNKAVGGTVVTNAAGLDNVGLLVKTTGVVGASGEANSFNLDDGSGVPLRAYMPNGGTLPAPGKYVSVTGIASCDKVGVVVQRMLQVISYQLEN